MYIMYSHSQEDRAVLELSCAQFLILGVSYIFALCIPMIATPNLPFGRCFQVVDLVQECLQRRGGREAADACAEVVAIAAARWRQFEGAYRDDISCLVLRLPCFRPAGSAGSCDSVNSHQVSLPRKGVVG